MKGTLLWPANLEAKAKIRRIFTACEAQSLNLSCWAIGLGLLSCLRFVTSQLLCRDLVSRPLHLNQSTVDMQEFAGGLCMQQWQYTSAFVQSCILTRRSYKTCMLRGCVSFSSCDDFGMAWPGAHFVAPLKRCLLQDPVSDTDV